MQAAHGLEGRKHTGDVSTAICSGLTLQSRDVFNTCALVRRETNLVGFTRFNNAFKARVLTSNSGNTLPKAITRRHLRV